MALVASEDRELPEDFGRRVRAAAGYMGLGIDKFAKEVNRPSASGSSMKAWGRGKNLPRPLSRESLIKRLAEVSELPEEFFWGDAELPTDGVAHALRELTAQLAKMDGKLTRIADAVEARPAPLKAGDLEELVDGMHSLATQAQEIINQQGPRIGKRDLQRRAALDQSRRRQAADG